MNKRSFVLLLIILTAICSFAVSSYGQGVVLPIICDRRPCPPPRPRPQPLPNVLPVKSIKIDTKIAGRVATTHVEQIFLNETSHTLEGKYFFPIPDSASVVEFAIWENGKKLVGEVRPRDEARKIYNEIVRTMRDPGLLEYAGKDLLEASIFPIPPRSEKKLEITYTQILNADSGTVAYKYPLGTGRNLKMFRTSEQSHTVSSNTKPANISGKIEIVENGKIRNVFSPTHNIDSNVKESNTGTVSFEAKDNDSDFQLFYTLSEKDFGLSLITHREPGKDGYFMMLLSPKNDIDNKKIINKDILFVIDTSGSMSDAGKIDKAKAALKFGVATLNNGDRFNIINFAGEEHLMSKSMIAADNAGRKTAEAFIDDLRPNGGTNINDTLISSLKQFDNGDRPKMLVFMTDGRPTVSVTNEETIVANLKKAKNVDVRIFPFGFGYDVNTYLLDRLGNDNGGVSGYVEPREDLEIKVSNFFSKVSSPVLSDLAMDLGGVETDLTYPKQMPDIFKGSQVSIIGRYKNSNDLKNIVMKLSGKSGKEARNFQYDNLEFPLVNAENKFLPRLWATRRVGFLIEQIRANGESKEVKDEIIELGTRYGIVTPYTSYLATDGSYNAFRQAGPGIVLDGVDRRSGRGGGRPKPARPDAAMKQRSGEESVRMSIQQNSMQSNDSFAGLREDKKSVNDILIRDSASNRFVNNRNFVRENDVWIDAEYDEAAKIAETNVKFGSDEFFALIAKEPELAEFFALGEEVVVIWKNNVYRVTK